MNCPKISQIATLAVTIVFLTGCALFPTTPQANPGQPPQPSGPQSGAQEPKNNIPPLASEQVLVSSTIDVPAGGGGADVVFEAANVKKFRIVLTGSSPTMRPYASLKLPNGKSQNSPPLNTAANGSNQIEISVNLNGQFTLTVFDGSKQGGKVTLTVTALP